ncbi:MAG: STAS domain-containing protein [Planctomycetes bacterium]|nr:STAS domain-containing protein [Planctomycetota bacterium]
MLSYVYRYIPAIDSLRTYGWTSLRRDAVAGITVAAVAVPQAMAYASIFGMPVEYGLYTAIVMTTVGALFDSSRQLINGPTNAISIAMLSALTVVPDEQRIGAAILMAFLIGVIQTGISLIRLGDLSRYISHAVIVGFTAGASVLLVLDQLKNALGLRARGDPASHFLKRFYLTMTEGGAVHPPTLLVTLGTIAAVLLFRWMNRRFRIVLPELLFAIVLAAVAVWYWDLAGRGVRLVEKVPAGLPAFKLPPWSWELSSQLWGSATAIGLLGLLEAIAMAKSIAAVTRQRLDINQQCLSEGLANVAGSFFQCFPGSGSLTRSYINHQAGAATQWSGVISAGMVALTVLGLAPLAEFIPRAALAAVLLIAATRMIDLPGLRYYCRATHFDAIIVLSTAAAAVLVSVEFCILIGVLLSFLFYVPRAARVEMNELILTPERIIRDRLPHDPACYYVRIFNFEGELFFGSAPDFENILQQIVDEQLTSDTRVVLLRIKYVRNPDAVCLQLLDQFLADVLASGRQVAVSGVRDDIYQALINVGIVERLGAERVFREFPEVWSSTMSALRWAYKQLDGQRCHHCPYIEVMDDPLRGWHYMI